MPYGGELRDHQLSATLNLRPYLFQKKKDKIQLVYAGAMLPKAYSLLEKIFAAIGDAPEIFKNVEFHFIGTGKLPDNPLSFNIKPLAEKYKLWQTVVFEHPRRIPYLDVLTHLNISDGVFILGSTEPHYTPSKTYQAVLSAKPVFAVLHKQSTAVKVLQDSRAGLVLSFDGEAGLKTVPETFITAFNEYKKFMKAYNPDDIDMELFAQYSAKNVTKALAGFLDKVV